MARTIQCNNCGAADLKKNSESEYQCNYCQARIVTEQPKFDFGSFLKTFNPNNLHQRTQTTYYADQAVTKNVSRLGCVIALVALLGIAAGIVVPIVIAVNENTEAGANNGWALSYTQQVYYAEGSKGPVAWIFQEENYNWKKSRSVLKIVDPVSGKTIHSETVVPEHKSSENVTGIWDLFNGGRVMGDTIFFTPKGKGLEGRHIYTAKKVLDQSHFAKKINSELAEAHAYNSSKEPYLRVKSADGTAYYYFPQKDELVPSDNYHQNKAVQKVYKYFFVLGGRSEKKAVLRIHQLADADETEGYFHQTYSEYKKNEKSYSRFYNISSIDSVPVNHGFFNAEIILNNDTSFVIRYKPTLMADAPLTIGCYTLHGKNLWKITPAQMELFRTGKKEQPDLSTFIVNRHLVVSLNSGIRAACGIDMRTGKLTWKYRMDK